MKFSKTEFMTKDKINFENNKNGFYLGTPNSKLHISIVSNPHCGFCKEANIILEKLLTNYPGEISAQIRFNYFPENESEISQKLTQALFSIYSNLGKEEFLNALHFWFEHRNEQLFFKNYKNSETSNMEEIIRSSFENKEKGLNFTPNIMLNGFPFPDKYEREDIFYFMDELLEDEEILK